MKTTTLIIIAICFINCKKDIDVSKPISTINVINAAIDIGSIRVNATGKAVSYLATVDPVAYSSNKFYYSEAGFQQLIAVKAIDTTQIIFKQSVDLRNGFNTLYLAGMSPEIDTLFRHESDIQFIKTDITTPTSQEYITYLRFVNLSPNSTALKINIKNTPTSELSDFTYKSISKWKPYVNNLPGPTIYIFEIRRIDTNELVLTYTFNANSTNRFRNVSLVIKGLLGASSGVNTFGIFQVNYF
jgi:hypothetical protein